MQLYGRDAELAALDDLLDRARTGTSGALVLRGEPGIGKTALLAEATERAYGFRVIRATGVEEEAELPFAGLHLLLRSALDRVTALPDVQAAALRGALGLAAKAGPPDRFLVGLAVLSLLAELAADQPLLCMVDDAHWLDRASTDAMLFAARRLDIESVVLLLATRPGVFPAAGLPELALKGLSAQAAAELLGPDLPADRRYRVLAEAAGNPLALLELPRALAAARPDSSLLPTGARLDSPPPLSDAGGTGPLPLTDRLRRRLEGQLTGLPEPIRALLLVAAAEGTGDLTSILRAAATLGAGLPDLEAARTSGLVEMTDRALTFRHPLIRAAVRTLLLYGEWLRREKRKADARTHLGTALEMFERLGATPWAHRARTELTATGTMVRPADHGLAGTLTPQELQIVRLAAQGLSNKDIAAQLFLSPRTVGHHLYKAYPKLGVASRGELATLDLS